MSAPNESATFSAMLHAAVRLAAVERLSGANSQTAPSGDVVSVHYSSRSRRVVRAVLAKLYRAAVPLARPVLARHRQYSTSIVLSEIARLRLEIQNVGASVSLLDTHHGWDTPRTRKAVPFRHSEVQFPGWFVNGRPMPNLNAGLEQGEREGSFSLTASGTPSQLAEAARDLSAWLERTSEIDSASYAFELRVSAGKR